MRLENNFVQVENNPIVINKVNSIAATFGWTVQSIQVTDSAVAYSTGAVTWATEFGAFTNNNVSVERTTYASITYQRNMDDPRYSKWAVLENEYNALEARSFLTNEEQKEIDAIMNKIVMEGKLLFGFGKFLFLAIAIALTIYGIKIGQEDSEMSMLCFVGCFLFVGLFYLVHRFIKVTKDNVQPNALEKNERYLQIRKNENSRKNAEKAAVLARARTI